jgi:hypothetical protein
VAKTKSIDAGHHPIAHNQADGVAIKGCPGFETVGGVFHIVPEGLERHSENLRGDGIVFGDEDFHVVRVVLGLW